MVTTAKTVTDDRTAIVDHETGSAGAKYERHEKMIKKCFVCVMLFVSWLVAATGDIKSVTVLGPDDYSGIFNGWGLEIGIEGLSTGGTYAMGLGANNDPTNATIAAIINGWQFGTGGLAEQTYYLPVYGTKQSRKPYPDNAVIYETAATTDPDGYDGVKVIVALSEYVYAGDDLASIEIGEGFYTQGGTPNNGAYDWSATNNSSLTCPKAIANWSWPGYQRFTGDITLRAVGFHGSASGGKPLKQINFYLVSAGAGGSTASKSVTVATIDSSIPDENPVIEYVATWTAAELAAMGIPFEDAIFTADFEALPLRTDSAGNGKLETDDGVNTGLTWKYTSQTHVYDAGGTLYAPTACYVDSASGNDSAAEVGNRAAPALTIKGAADKIRAHNLATYSRDNSAGGFIYLETGNHAWIGGTWAGGTNTGCWLTIAPAPGASATISATSGSKTAGALCRLYGVSIVPSQNLLIKFVESCLWVSDSVVNNGTGAYTTTIYGDGSLAGAVYFTDCNIDGPDIIYPYSSYVGHIGLVRGCRINANPATTRAIKMYPSTFIGNKIDGRISNSFFEDKNLIEGRHSDGGIIAFNELKNSKTASILMSHAYPSGTYATAYTHGMAIVQNLWESAPAASSAQLLSIATFMNPVTNLLVMQNTFVGARTIFNYNSDGDVAKSSSHFVYKNNYVDDFNVKSDVFPPGSGNRTGNWITVYGVAMSGNAMDRRSVVEVGGFLPDFAGLSTRIGTTTTDEIVTNFVDDKSAHGNVGYGDYHVGAGSELIGLASDWVLPYDLDGNARKAGGAAGAYEYTEVNTRVKRWWGGARWSFW